MFDWSDMLVINHKRLCKIEEKLTLNGYQLTLCFKKINWNKYFFISLCLNYEIQILKNVSVHSNAVDKVWYLSHNFSDLFQIWTTFSRKFCYFVKAAKMELKISEPTRHILEIILSSNNVFGTKCVVFF